MISKIITSPEAKRAATYTATNLSKLGALSVASIYSGKLLRKSAEAFVHGVGSQIDGVKSLYDQHRSH